VTPTIETGYRLSARVTLQPGDTFRVAGGPYYRLAAAPARCRGGAMMG
jgi:hypothetical protein